MNHAISINSPSAWWLACRPKTLGAISCPVIIGSALALSQGSFDLAIFVVTLSCSLLLQILANVVNDYCDCLKGSDTKERLGPPRAMQLGIITPTAMQKGMGLILLMIIFLGMLLVFRGGIPILVLGMLCIFFSIWYTAGPKPLSYLGFSELAVVLFFGPLPLLGSYYCQTMTVSWIGFMASIGPAFLSTALIMTNNLRDIVEDQRNNKRTLAVRFGPSFSRLAIVALVCGALFSPLVLVVVFDYHWLLMSACLSLLVPAQYFRMILTEPITARFNHMLGGIGQALYLYGLLMSAGLIYGAP